MAKGLSKNDSLAIKGIAVLMLLYHHLYTTPDRWSGFDISFFPLSEDLATGISTFFKLCVSIFAFITGYGLLKSVSKVTINRKNVFGWNVTRLVKTMSGFWFIYIIAFIVTMIIDQRPVKVYFSGGTSNGIIYLILDFLGLANLFGTPTLCGTWWYMSAAIIFILLIPVIYAVSKKFGYLPIIMILTALPRLLKTGFPGGVNAYSFIFPMIFGMIFADYGIFERIEERLPKNKAVSYLLNFVFFGGMTVLFYYISTTKYNSSKAWELNWGVSVIFMMGFFRFCVVRIPVLTKALQFLGKHSMTMFLTHTFIRYTYLNEFTYTVHRNFLVIFLVLFVLSLALTLLLDGIKKLVKYDEFVGKFLSKLNKKITG